MSNAISVIDNNYYALKDWEQLLEKVRWLLIDTGKNIEFQITADSLGPLSVGFIFPSRFFPVASSVIGIRGKSHLQVVSDIINAICPATPQFPDVSRHERKQRKNAASRGKEAV